MNCVFPLRRPDERSLSLQVRAKTTDCRLTETDQMAKVVKMFLAITFQICNNMDGTTSWLAWKRSTKNKLERVGKKTQALPLSICERELIS